MEKALKEKRADLEKLGNQKKEEFIKSANSLFDKIAGVDVIQKDYYNGLKAAVGDSNEKVEESKDSQKELLPESVETV
jgi:hypothetical protein